MRSVLLMLMVSVTQVQLSPCPPSCVVCTEEATICTRLSGIIEVPGSTKAFMLTDGLIDTVDSTHLLDLPNVSVLVLSYNLISTIRANAFQNLTALTTLLLDHNQISSPSLDGSTFSWMRDLETLGLGHNALREVHGSWFERSDTLKTLLLQGNFLTELNSGTFASSDLRNLETLDLSDNLISHVDWEGFRELPRLRRLDLSRNRLKATPGTFVDLPHLSVLNLELNDWTCSCELVELHFLSSDEPSVRTLMDPTAWNIPAKIKMSMMAAARRSIPPRRYTRDVALTSAFSCLGGVVITLAVLAVVRRKLSRKCTSCQGKNGVAVQSSQGSVQWDFSEGPEARPVSCALRSGLSAVHQPWDKDNSSFKTAPDFTDDHFFCQNCGSDCLGPRSRRAVIQHLKRDDDWSRQTGEDHRKVGGHQSRTKVSTHELFNGTGRGSQGLAAIRRETSQNHVHHKFLKHEQTEETPRIYQTLNCSHCHHALEYKQIRNEERDYVLTHHRPGSRAILYRNAVNHSPSNVYWQSAGQTRVQRSVSFDLSIVPNHESDGPYRIHRTKKFKTQEQERSPKSAKTNMADSRGRSKVPKPRPTGKRKLKMKFNLNPFRKSQVHPRPEGQEVVDADNTPKKDKGENDKPQKTRVKKKTTSRSKEKPLKDKATKNDDPDLKRVSKSSKDETSELSEHPEGVSDLIDESEDAAITQLLKLTTPDTRQVLNQDMKLPPSTLEDTGSKKHLEDSAQAGLGSNLVAERTDMAPTQALNINTTDIHRVLNLDSNLPPSTLEDIGSKKHLEDSAQPGLGSNRTNLALAQPLSTIHPMNLQQAINPRTHDPTNQSTTLVQSQGLLAPKSDTGNNPDLQQVTSPDVDLPVNVNSSQTFSRTAVTLPQDADLATTQPFNLGNATVHRPQDQDVDLNLPAGASEIQRPSEESITPPFSNHSVVQEYPSSGGVSPKRKIRLVVKEKASTRPLSALDKKIR